MNVCGLHGKQQIQLMDAQSLPHAYLDSARATFAYKLIKYACTLTLKILRKDGTRASYDQGNEVCS